jgi:hypothetical protein
MSEHDESVAMIAMGIREFEEASCKGHGYFRTARAIAGEIGSFDESHGFRR